MRNKKAKRLRKECGTRVVYLDYAPAIYAVDGKKVKRGVPLRLLNVGRGLYQKSKRYA